MFRKLFLLLACLGIFLVFAQIAQAGGCGVAIEEVSPGVAGLHGAYIGVTVCEPSAEDPMVNINPAGHSIEIHIVDRSGEEYCKMNETITNDYGKASGQCYSTTTESFQIYAIDTTSGKESVKLSLAMKGGTYTDSQSNPTPSTTPSPSAPSTPIPTTTPQPTATTTPTPSPKATPKPTATPVIVKAEVIKQEETTSSSHLESSPAAEILADSETKKNNIDNKIINTNLSLGFISLVLGLATGIGLPLSWYLWQTNNKFKNSLISFWQKMPKLKLLKKYWPKKKLG